MPDLTSNEADLAAALEVLQIHWPRAPVSRLDPIIAQIGQYLVNVQANGTWGYWELAAGEGVDEEGLPRRSSLLDEFACAGDAVAVAAGAALADAISAALGLDDDE